MGLQQVGNPACTFCSSRFPRKNHDWKRQLLILMSLWIPCVVFAGLCFCHSL